MFKEGVWGGVLQIHMRARNGVAIMNMHKHNKFYIINSKSNKMYN